MMSQVSIDAASGRPAQAFRPEIQGLRAIAVLAVLVYHLWPAALPGGYVGVDVFFVVSGYLITGGLFGEAMATGRIAVGAFYARRIRRLLPAATGVLVAAAILLAWLPPTRWQAGSAEIVASAFYVQNWWLAERAVDYLASADAPGLLTHFWSLAIEEQYYIAWPLLLCLALSWPGARSKPRQAFVWLGVGIVLLSLSYSVWLTGTRPALAYFSTFTRAWELGLGGLLAVALRWHPSGSGLRDLLGGVGLVAILASMLVFDGTTAFPGIAALWPVLGTMAVLAAGCSDRRFSAFGLLARPVFQYIGGISYSLYLWHWPVIVLHAALTGRSPDVLEGIAVLVIAGLLAHASKVGIEDRFRSAKAHAQPGWTVPAGALLAACLVLSVGAALAGLGWRDNRLVDDGPGFARHPGAAVLAGEVDAIGESFLPVPEAAGSDLPAPFTDGCLASGGVAASCRYGAADAPIRIALVGDRAAAQWQPTLEVLARHNGWRLDLFANPGCALGVATTDGCREWQAGLETALRTGSFRLALLAQSSRRRIDGVADDESLVEALDSGLQMFAANVVASGTPLALVRGVPDLADACEDSGGLRECSRDRAQALAAYDPILVAAAQLSGVELFDLTDALCGPASCAAVVGNVIVYRDDGYLTATYARSLAQAFATRMQELAGLEAIDVPTPAGLVRYGNLGVLATRAGRDDPDLYRDDCHVDRDSVHPEHCLYGDPDSDVHIALVGDSHAAQWLPPLQAQAEREGWALYSFTKSACSFTDAVVVIEGSEYLSCTEWNRNLLDALRELRPSLVVTSQSRGHQAHGAADAEAGRRMLAEGLLSRWRALREADIPVLVIADTPWMRVHVPDCIAAGPERGDSCDTRLADALGMPDPILLAMQSTPDVVFADLNPHICTQTHCPAFADGEVVWRDQHHLTASYARGLAPVLAPVLRQAIAGAAVAERVPDAIAP